MRFCSLAVVIPAYNEEEGIGCTILELKNVVEPSCIVVVDGKSEDGTVQNAEKLGVDIFFQEGKGKGDAVCQGLMQLKGKFEYVALIDADYTYPSVHLREMVKVLDGDPNVGMVLGNRFNREFETESVRDKFYVGNRLLSQVHEFCNGIHLDDPLTGLRVIRCEILKDWKPNSKGFDIEIELNCYVKRVGYRIVEVPIRYRPRLGKKKLGFRHGLEVFNRIISDAFNPMSA